MCRCHLMGRTDAWVSTPLSHWTQPAGWSWGLELPSRARFPGWKLVSATPRGRPLRPLLPPARSLACNICEKGKCYERQTAAPPPVPSARPRRHDPAKPQQLRAHPSVRSAHRDLRPGRSGTAPARRAAIPPWASGLRAGES